MIRSVLAALALLAATPVAAQRACPNDRFEQAFRFAFPVYQMARTRAESSARVAATGSSNVNAFNHRTTLSDHTHRNVTTPNNDTLYSAAWIDLAAGPVRLHLPPAADRYVSVALMDLFTDHFAVLHPRADAGEGVWLAGPDWRGRIPRGSRLIRAPMNDVWAIGRTYVAGPRDLAAARAVQAQLRIEQPAPAARPFAEAAPPLRDPERFVAVVNEALGRGPLPAAHAARVRRFACTGIRPGETSAWERLPLARQQAWRAQLPGLYDALRGGLQDAGRQVDGWSYPAPGIGRFGTDDLYRARIALGGLGALPADEAMYLSVRTDSHGAPLEGGRAYSLRIPAGIPAGAFWSLSLYEIADDGRLFFAANPIGRYAITSRDPDLRREADGSLVIRIRSEEATGRANWLPSPPAGRVALTFRAYRPGPALRDGRFRLPAVVRHDQPPVP